MDIEANKKEQAEIASDIMSLWDECPEDGNPTQRQLDIMYLHAFRLAELVQAANQWEKMRR